MADIPPETTAGEFEEQLQLICPLDRRGVESLFLELQKRARHLGLDIEMVRAERCRRPARGDPPSQSGEA